MPNLMQTGAAWLAERLAENAGLVVSIRQGREQRDDVTGWVALQEYEVHDAQGIVTTALRHDWTFATADVAGLEFDRGATITTADGDRYEAQPVGDKPVAEPLDAHAVMTLVHTRKVSAES